MENDEKFFFKLLVLYQIIKSRYEIGLIFKNLVIEASLLINRENTIISGEKFAIINRESILDNLTHNNPSLPSILRSYVTRFDRVEHPKKDRHKKREKIRAKNLSTASQRQSIIVHNPVGQRTSELDVDAYPRQLPRGHIRSDRLDAAHRHIRRDNPASDLFATRSRRRLVHTPYHLWHDDSHVPARLPSRKDPRLLPGQRDGRLLFARQGSRARLSGQGLERRHQGRAVQVHHGCARLQEQACQRYNGAHSRCLRARYQLDFGL